MARLWRACQRMQVLQLHALARAHDLPGCGVINMVENGSDTLPISENRYRIYDGLWDALSQVGTV